MARRFVIQEECSSIIPTQNPASSMYDNSPFRGFVSAIVEQTRAVEYPISVTSHAGH